MGGSLNSACTNLSFSSALALHLIAALQKVHHSPGRYSPSPLKADSAFGFKIFSAHSFKSLTENCPGTYILSSWLKNMEGNIFNII